MEIDHKYAYKFYVVHILYVKRHKHGNGAKLSGYVNGKFNIIRICYSKNYEHK